MDGVVKNMYKLGNHSSAFGIAAVDRAYARLQRPPQVMLNTIMTSFGIIAGNGVYPLLVARSARKAGIQRLVAVAFQNETDPKLAELVDEVEWIRVGQLAKMVACFRKRGIGEAVMAGQINPKHLFDLRPDVKALLLLARLKTRNAESIFGAIAGELGKSGVTLLPATTFLEDCLARPGLIAGPKLNRREEEDITYGFGIAKEMSRLDIGQTVIVKKGTVLAVEAFEGTNETIKRGGALGRRDAIMIKVSKPNQDFRFDVPVIGPRTLETARDAQLRAIAVEAGKTLVLEKEAVLERAAAYRISVVGKT